MRKRGNNRSCWNCWREDGLMMLMMVTAPTTEHSEPGRVLSGGQILTYYRAPGAVSLAFNVSQMGFMSPLVIFRQW